MKLGMKALAGCLAVVAATAVAMVPATTGWAGPCQRTVRIDPQESGGEGTGALTFVVESSGCNAAGSVAYSVVSGTATAGADFHPVSGSLSWLAGDGSHRSISVPIVPDAATESDLEDLAVRLTAPSADVQLAEETGQGRIIDDESGTPVGTVDDTNCPILSRMECMCTSMPMPKSPVAAFCVPFDVPMNLGQPASSTVVWSTVDGTARAGVDFVGVVNRVQTIPAGGLGAELRVALLPRPAGTPTRWFGVEVSAISTGTVADALAVVTLPGL